jgi:hypothetical protein
MKSQEPTTARHSRIRPGQTLFVALALACLAFWTGADFLHFDEGPDTQPDCPVCHLDRITSGEPASVSVGAGAVALLPLRWLELPLPARLIEADEPALPSPRGPPSA